jgi:hypothetical protein
VIDSMEAMVITLLRTGRSRFSIPDRSR